MIMDERNEFCDALALTVADDANWHNIGDVIDRQATGITDVDLGVGGDIYFVLAITTDIDAAAAGTIQFRLVSDDNSTPSVAAPEHVHWLSSAIVTAATPPATLLAGVVLAKIRLPLELYDRYIGLQVTVASTEAVTAGGLNAFLTPHPDAYYNLPANNG
jgi:hypothetical protein